MDWTEILGEELGSRSNVSPDFATEWTNDS